MKGMNEELDLLELQAMIVGGIYYKRFPGRGIAIRREYRPIGEVLAEALFNVAKVIVGWTEVINRELKDRA